MVCWPASGSPFGLRNSLEFMPRRRASAFIMATKPASLPPTVSAIAMAMSFAERTIIIFSALSTVIAVPTLKPIFEGGSASALADTTTGDVSLSRPALSALKAR